MADNVVIDGFTVQNSSDTSPSSFFAGIWTNPASSGTQGGHQILNNIIQDNISGIELDSTCAANPTLVQFNLIQNNNNPGPGSGNGIQTNFGLCNATIDNNKFSGHTSSSVLVVSFSGNDNNITVSNNELVGGSADSIDFLAVSNSAITGNTSIGSTATGSVDLFGGNSNITVTGNILGNGRRGIQVEDPFSVGPNSNITANTNCIVGNGVAGLEVATGTYTGAPGSLNAENNWWGSADGPAPTGSGNAVVDPDGVVDYTPFLTAPAPICAAAPCTAPPAGMVSWWILENNGNDIYGPNNGTLDKAAPAFVTGKVGQALSVNGSNGIIVPDNSSLDFGPGADLSIDAWIRTSDTTRAVLSIVDKRVLSPPDGSGVVNGYTVFLINGALAFQLGDGTYQNFLALSGDLRDGQWHHIAITVDRDSPTGGTSLCGRRRHGDV